jgi:YwiC-like protein
MGWLKDTLPKEHGTWAMLLAPWAIGCGVARRLDAWEITLLASMLLAFLAQHQLAAWLRLRRGAASRADAARLSRQRVLVLVTAAALTGLPLVARLGTAFLGLAAIAGALGGGALALVHRRVERALPGQVLAAIGLPVSAPAAHAVATGQVGAVGVELWALCALFFLGAVVYVRLKILAIARVSRLGSRAARVAFAAPTLAMETVIAAAAVALALLGPLSPLVGLAFVPVAVQAIAGTLTLHRRAHLKRVGILSTAHAAIFAAIVIAFGQAS